VRGAAVADLHLGFSAFPTLRGGRNAREQDVEIAWDRAVDTIITAQPDLVTVAGDCLHHARVSDYAKRALQLGLRRIAENTAARVIVIPGNHDGSKTVQVLSPVVLADGHQRIHIVTDTQRVVFTTRAGERVNVACYPFVALAESGLDSIDPDPDCDVNVMLIHAAVRTSEADGALPRFYAGDVSIDVGRHAEAWDVIAAGDYHEFTRLHPTRLAFYSGSIERTSSNMWPETAPKGVVVYDTETNELEFRDIPTRPVFDVAAPHWPLMDKAVNAAELNIMLSDLATKPEYRDAIVRLKVDGFPREERMQIDAKLVRALKALTFHFQLDISFAARERVAAGDRRERASQPIGVSAEQFFAEDPEPVRECALEYLAAAGGVA